MAAACPRTQSEPAVQVPVDWTFPAVAMDAAGRLTPFWRDVANDITQSEISLGAGQYTMTADGKPIIGAAGGVDGLFVHGGDNGWGIESAPEAGRRLAEIVVAGVDSAGQPVPHRPPIDHRAEGASRHRTDACRRAAPPVRDREPGGAAAEVPPDRRAIASQAWPDNGP